MPDLQVDLAGLDDFGGRLGRIRDSLDAGRSVVGAYEDAIGPGLARDALHRFEQHWRDGRGHVRNNAATLSSMATESVAAYRKIDQDLADAMREATDG